MEDYYWIWLSRISEIGPVTILKLLKNFKSPENIWRASRNDLMNCDIKEKYVSAILKNDYRKNLDKFLDYLNKNNIKIINFFDDSYPNKLKNIYSFPITLYVKGNISILNDLGIAIVGCRDSSKYGEKIAYNFSYNLAKNNVNIISGLAKGIDTCVHTGGLKAKGKNIAVMGCGLDMVYPSSNKNIFDEIIATGGAVISEYIIGTRPIPENFPRRNRIISGLSDGVLVVEAKQKSGTLITANFALEQGKDIFVIPRKCK